MTVTFCVDVSFGFSISAPRTALSYGAALALPYSPNVYMWPWYTAGGFGDGSRRRHMAVAFGGGVLSSDVWRWYMAMAYGGGTL